MKTATKNVYTPTLFSSVKKLETLFSDDLMQVFDPKTAKPYINGSLLLDVQKADRLLLQMVEWFEEGRGHFQHNNVANAPQNLFMPASFSGRVPAQVSLDGMYEQKPVVPMKKASLDHLQWVFPTVGSDRRQESTNVYRNHALLYHDMPELYRGEAQHWSREDLKRLLSSRKFGIPGDTSRDWPYQARTLFKSFGGDPIKLLEYCGGTVAGVLAFKENWKKENGAPTLPGFGPKITSLLYLFYEELGKFPMPEDAFAVDLHVQRFFLQTKAIVLKGTTHSSMMEKVLRPYLCGFSFRFDKSKVDVAHGLWQNGSKMCDVCTNTKGSDVLCPVEKECKGSVHTESYNTQRMWTYPLHFRPKFHDRPFAVKEDSSLFKNTA